jgi:glycosyl hydrolase family 26
MRRSKLDRGHYKSACLLLALLGSVVFAVASATVASACAPGQLPALAVPHAIYDGAFADSSAGEHNEEYVTSERIRSFERLAGKRIAWAYFSQNFFAGLSFPRAAVMSIWRSSAVPVIRLMPWSAQVENSPEPTYTLERIAQGDYDTSLRHWGRGAAASGRPLVVDFGPEVNGDWFPWNGLYHGGATQTAEGPTGPATFRAAYRRVVTDIRSGGARNVEFAFHVEDYSEPEAAWNEPALYYPGDGYVDWVGLSIYGDPPVQPFSEALHDAYAQLAEFAPRKPVAIFEFAAPQSIGGKAKAAWIRGAFATLTSGHYRRIHAASWWDESYREDGSVYDYRINSSPIALHAYRASVRSGKLLSRPQVTCR